MTSQLEHQANLLSDCINSLKTWKELIDTHLEGEEKSAEVNELEEIVKEYCLIDFTASKTSEACQEVVDYFAEESADPNVDVDDLYKDKLAQKQESFCGNYSQHKIWKEVFQGITDHDVEEVQASQSEEPVEYEEMNDSIFYSNVFTPPVDPISKKVIRDPYKNRKCGHVYEYKFILQYIKSMKNKAKCPYIGCSNKNISVRELVPDKETQNKINNYLSQANQNSSQGSVDSEND
ncbi:hypothetical protein Zmor_022267 [Zophobas morio]|uniref:E3 SUMO-protein ligase NSE2 n=1 Tax=Zophobas morio TaxID=2755281 RepID=A0AA38M6J5_9CUCU|nr:hypothetical protein Zmor_022267 [Zophobas morio]